MGSAGEERQSSSWGTNLWILQYFDFSMYVIECKLTEVYAYVDSSAAVALALFVRLR